MFFVWFISRSALRIQPNTKPPQCCYSALTLALITVRDSQSISCSDPIQLIPSLYYVAALCAPKSNQSGKLARWSLQFFIGVSIYNPNKGTLDEMQTRRQPHIKAICSALWYELRVHLSSEFGLLHCSRPRSQAILTHISILFICIN